MPKTKISKHKYPNSKMLQPDADFSCIFRNHKITSNLKSKYTTINDLFHCNPSADFPTLTEPPKNLRTGAGDRVESPHMARAMGASPSHPARQLEGVDGDLGSDATAPPSRQQYDHHSLRQQVRRNEVWLLWWIWLAKSGILACGRTRGSY